MNSKHDILSDSPGFIGMVSFTKTGLPIEEYGSKEVKHQASGICSTMMQIRNSLSSSLINESISLTIDTTKRRTFAVESKDIILVLSKSVEDLEGNNKKSSERDTLNII